MNLKEKPVKICLIDMNNGVANQSTRCFRRIVDAFKGRIREMNPRLTVHFEHLQPRNLGELPDLDTDIILSSGGPGSPFDGWNEPWGTGYRALLDHIIEQNRVSPADSPKLFAVCYSFELACEHLGVARMQLRRDGTKFGVMPAYITSLGQQMPYLFPFADRLFAFENRDWEAVDLDEARLRELGGTLLARESRPGLSDKGEALVAFHFAPGITGTQFHPEADRQGVLTWVQNPEQAARFKKVYGELTYDRMVKTLDNPKRVARTFAMLIPTWLTLQFNRLAGARGYKALDAPEQDMESFLAEPRARAAAS